MKRCSIDTEFGTFTLRDERHGGLSVVLNDSTIVAQHFWDTDDGEFWKFYNTMDSKEKRGFFMGILCSDVEEYKERHGGGEQ